MLNMFLYSVFGQVDTTLRAIAKEETILNYRNTFFDRLVKENSIEAIMAVGKGAEFILDHWPGSRNIPIVGIVHPAAPNESMLLASWNNALEQLRDIHDAHSPGTSSRSECLTGTGMDQAASAMAIKKLFGRHLKMIY